MRVGITVLLSVAVACGGSEAPTSDAGGDGGTDGGADTCRSDRSCATGERCASSGVHEVEYEPGESGTCTPAGEVIGGAPATWPFAPGGRPLADRLCMAQGLAEGAGAEADAIRARQRELLAAAGVRAIRLDLRWARVEPERGAFDFSRVDPMIDAAVDADLDVLAILAYGVPWATTATDDDDKFPPDDPADYAAYAGEVATHFAGRVHRYELWNEPNGGYRFFLPDANGDAARYADLMVAGADAVHDACPDCVVYSAGLFFHEQLINGTIEFLHDLLTARPDALDAVDVLAFHPYPVYPPIAAPEADAMGERAMGGMVTDLRDVVALHDGPELPLAATELGWPSFEAVDEATQARYLARAVLLGASLGLDPLCWFNLADGPSHGSFPPEDDFGLYRFGSEDPDQPVSPKPARDALAWLASIGDGAVPAGPVDDPALHDPSRGRFALRFEADTSSFVALWRVDGEATVDVGSLGTTAYDLVGAELGTASGGHLEVTVGPDPVYVVE